MMRAHPPLPTALPIAIGSLLPASLATSTSGLINNDEAKVHLNIKRRRKIEPGMIDLYQLMAELGKELEYLKHFR